MIKKGQRGFTIIEVLIVLAIAGLIMLIVFLAVPALQRNARNTSLRSDVSSVMAGVSEFTTNNNGKLPNTIAVSGSDVTISSTVTGTQQTIAKVKEGTLVSVAATPPVMPTNDQTGTIFIAFQYKCNNNVFATTTSARAFSAGYRVEGGNNTNATQCQES